jgi:DNA invertase Pin-like site-specific DNA recombinase
VKEGGHDRAGAWERLGGNIADRQLERLAVVYVRQSTRQQVLDHGESTRLQYGLVQRAVGLGWAASRVLVIDEDLGKSGASTAGRAGFQRLVTEITMGHVGLVLGIEMSRLARSGADWYQLLELCALAGALLADADGVYDPVDYNDRLLLGLKGTMSEAELHLPEAADAGRQAGQGPAGSAGDPAADRLCAPPRGRGGPGPRRAGPDGGAADLFEVRRARHPAWVLRWLVDYDVQLGIRLHAGPDKGELVWRRPNRMTLQNILHSPVYAGIYAYGRRRVDPRRQLPGRPSTGRVVRAEDEWLVAIPAVLPAYITIEAYHANLARLAANAARAVTSCLRATRAWYPACFGRWPLPIVGTSGLVLGRGIGRLPGSSVRVSDPGAAPLSRLAGVRHVRSPRFPTATVAESAAAG